MSYTTLAGKTPNRITVLGNCSIQASKKQTINILPDSFAEMTSLRCVG